MSLIRAICLQLFLCAVFVFCDVTNHHHNNDNLVKARKYVYVKTNHGEPKRTDYQIVEEDLAPIKDGEFLAKALYISVDPVMRLMASKIPVGSDMRGGQIAKVIQSKNIDFPVNVLVFGNFGWRTHTVVNPETQGEKNSFYKLPDFGGLSPSLGLGVLGMPGITGLFGMVTACRPKRGETVAVTSAAGTVGSTAGQIAHILGSKVIGFAGTNGKCNWLKEIGFDYAINYKTSNIDVDLNIAAPNGIDCFFDNVGGHLSDTIIGHMNYRGRVVKVGSISTYNLEPNEIPTSSVTEAFIKNKELEIGQLASRNFINRWQDGIAQNLKWIHEGKLKYHENIIEGFDKLVDTYVGLLRGDYTGKPVVKV